VLAPGRDATPGLTLAREAEAALPGRREVRLDLLLLAALSDRDHESAALERRWFARSTDPEVKAGLRRAHLVASVRRAARLADAGDLAGAESALRAARAEAEDPAETRQVDEQIAALARARTSRAETARENEAIREYNVGVAASNAERHAEAAAAFRRAAARTGRASFRAEATAMAERMDLRLTMGRVESLVRAGRRGEALRVLEGIDRTRLNAEDRRWVEENRTRLRGGR
jgi:tetratricopeptide (TPR) repeat protein